MKIIKENALYRYTKGKEWTTHGIIYTIKDKKGQLMAIDTYWDSRFDKGLNTDTSKKYFVADIADDLEYIMMIDEAKELDKNEFYLYTNNDALHIPTGGWHERYLVTKNAKKNVNTVIESIKYKMDSNEREIKNLISENARLEEWLSRVEVENDIAQLYTNSNYEFEVEYAIDRASKGN